MASLARCRGGWSLKVPPSWSRQRLACRQFSASPRSRTTLTDIAIAGPNAFIDAIHSTGLPYWAALPLTGVLVRGVFVYYIAVKPAHRKAELANYFKPLVSARVRMLLSTADEQARIARGKGGRRWTASIRATWHYVRSTWMYQSKFGGSNIPWGLINFGALITFAETIRLKCGRQEGLLTMILTPLENMRKMLAEATSGPTEPEAEKVVNPAEALAARLQAAFDAQTAKAKEGELVEYSDASELAEAVISGNVKLEPISKIDTTSHYFDAALQSEGLSWCPDLTLVDATPTLPLLTGAVILGAFWFKPAVIPPRKTPDPFKDGLGGSKSLDEVTADVARPKTTLKDSFERARGQRTSVARQIPILGALLFASMASHFPAAVLLYLIPNLAVGWLQSRYLDLRYPKRPAITQCKRMLRFRAKQEWND